MPPLQLPQPTQALTYQSVNVSVSLTGDSAKMACSIVATTVNNIFQKLNVTKIKNLALTVFASLLLRKSIVCC